MKKLLVILTVAMFAIVALNSVTSALWRSDKAVVAPQAVSKATPSTPVAGRAAPQTFRVSGSVTAEIK